MHPRTDRSRSLETAVLAARYVGDAIARLHVEEIDQAEGDGLHEHWLRVRLAEELRSAICELRTALENPAGLATCSAGDLAHLVEIARTWADTDPTVERAEHALMHHLEHHGIRTEISDRRPANPRTP